MMTAIEHRKQHNNHIKILQKLRGLISSSASFPGYSSPSHTADPIRQRRRLTSARSRETAPVVTVEGKGNTYFDLTDIPRSRSPIETFVDLDNEEMPPYSSFFSNMNKPRQLHPSLTLSSKQLKSRSSKGTFRNIPITIIDKDGNRTVVKPKCVGTIPNASIIKKDDELILIEDKEDEAKDERIVVDTLSDKPNRTCMNSQCTLGRRSLHEGNIRKQSISDGDDVIIMDEDPIMTVKEKNFRQTNKVTLVGGANKVLEDSNTHSQSLNHVNIDIDSVGAGFLSQKNLGLNNPPSFEYDMCLQSDVHDVEKPVNDLPNFPIYISLKKKLIQECRVIDHIKGDGNCFFRALSKQLYGSEKYHLVVRNLLVDLIATNKNKFAQFVDGGDVQDHVERMSQEGCWATTCEIYAAATFLHRDIFMLTPDHLNQSYSWLLFKPVFDTNPDEYNIESHPCYITLCNTNGNHYDRIVGEHGSCNCFMPHPELEGLSYSVDLTD